MRIGSKILGAWRSSSSQQAGFWCAVRTLKIVAQFPHRSIEKPIKKPIKKLDRLDSNLSLSLQGGTHYGSRYIRPAMKLRQT
jgi:hypothetical protein